MLFALFEFRAFLHFFDEYLGRLENGNVMLVDNDGGIFRNIPRHLLGALLVDEAPETPDINVVSVGHRTFHYAEKCLECDLHIGFVNTCLFGYLGYYFCFGHLLSY